jgi:hypothetical protein
MLYRDPISGQGRAARCRQGARADRGPDQAAVVTGLGLVGGRGRAEARRRTQPQSGGPAAQAGDRPGSRTDRDAAASVAAPGRLRPDPRSAGRTRADRAGRDARPPGHRMGQGRHRRAEVHEGRLSRARHAHLHETRLQFPGRGQGHRARSRDHSFRRPAHLRHDPEGRHARHLPDREPRPDGDAAADEAAHVLRSRHRGRHRPTGPHPGRYGPSVFAPARRKGAGRVSEA